MILTLHNQVSSLESSKRLKELGFIQESLFYWSVLNSYMEPKIIGRTWRTQTRSLKTVYSAYTASELGEFLPMEINCGTFDCGRMKAANNWWVCGYGDAKRKSVDVFQTAKTEAEARAKMLIYLKEQGLI